jgi:hypothetical protein
MTERSEGMSACDREGAADHGVRGRSHRGMR